MLPDRPCRLGFTISEAWLLAPSVTACAAGLDLVARPGSGNLCDEPWLKPLPQPAWLATAVWECYSRAWLTVRQ